MLPWLLVFWLASSTIGTTFDNCDTEHNAIFQATSLAVYPDPPRRGTQLYVHVEGTFAATVDAGTLTVEVHFGKILLMRRIFDFCAFFKAYESYGLPQCPFPDGPFVYDSTFTIPLEAPAGVYVVKAHASTIQGRMIFCYVVQTRLISISQTDTSLFQVGPLLA